MNARGGPHRPFRIDHRSDSLGGMSFLDKLLLWLHIGFTIFAIGPLTAATMFTPRYIRARDAGVVRYLHRNTRVFGVLTLGVFLFGLALAGSKIGTPYLSVSMTLFIVAAVLLVIIDRDHSTPGRGVSHDTPAHDPKVQTGRIATLSSVVALIWLVILVLMVWFDPPH